MGADADYLVLDLGSALTQLVKCTLPLLHALGVVVDLAMLSVECARRMLNTIGARRTYLSTRAHRNRGGEIRASLACPFSVDELQRLVGMPVLGTVPPSADLCNAAEKARRPVVILEPESTAARSLVQIASSIAELT